MMADPESSDCDEAIGRILGERETLSEDAIARVQRDIRDAIDRYRGARACLRPNQLHRAYLETLLDRAEALDAYCDPIAFAPDFEADDRALRRELYHLQRHLAVMRGLARILRDKHQARRGRPTDDDRQILEDTIGCALVVAGVVPTASADGTLAQIFEVVYLELDLDASPDHAVRRICGALPR